jgi:hypothetical protein
MALTIPLSPFGEGPTSSPIANEEREREEEAARPDDSFYTAIKQLCSTSVDIQLPFIANYRKNKHRRAKITNKRTPCTSWLSDSSLNSVDTTSISIPTNTRAEQFEEEGGGTTVNSFSEASQVALSYRHANVVSINDNASCKKTLAKQNPGASTYQQSIPHSQILTTKGCDTSLKPLPRKPGRLYKVDGHKVSCESGPVS